MKAIYEPDVILFTPDIEIDCKRFVRLGEQGMTVGHKIDEATGRFHVLTLAVVPIRRLVAFGWKAHMSRDGKISAQVSDSAP